MLKVVKLSHIVAVVFAVAAGSASLGLSAQEDMSNEAIEKRISAIGKVKTGDADAGSETADAGPRSGDAVYNRFCTACHGSGALGAPKTNVAGDWEPRLEQGMETVLKHAIEGFNAMPPRGTCNDCSDDEIEAAIEYMIADI